MTQPPAFSVPIPLPVQASFPSSNLTIGAGVAIFHLASSQVVLCWHSRDKYWFLPKGRKDEGETLEAACVREGWEESGFDCRLIGGVWTHRQPVMKVPLASLAKDSSADTSSSSTQSWSQVSNTSIDHSTTKTNVDDDFGLTLDSEGKLHHIKWPQEAIYLQILPLSHRHKVQYLLFWYIAETLPPVPSAAEVNQTQASKLGELKYTAHPPLRSSMTISERIAQEPNAWLPTRTPNTGVDAEEALYEAYLVDIGEAQQRLLRTDRVQADVVRRGWEGLTERKRREDEAVAALQKAREKT